MSEPTKEQIKEFWEGYGVEEEWTSFTTKNYPHIDLNNLFLHCVPQALKVIAERGYCPAIMKLFQLWYDELVTQTGDSSNIEQAALALFWALREVKGTNT